MPIMRILVTGGAGFIGSNFVNHLVKVFGLERDITKIVILDSLTYAGNMDNLSEVLSDPRVEFIQGSILDSYLVSKVMAEIDIVVHFAAESHVDRSIQNGEIFVLTNVVGTQVLLQVALDHSIKKFIHVSTDEVYGSINSGSWDETCPLKPNSPYSASKAASDLLALSYHKTFNLPVIVTRCSNNYGPCQNQEKLIPLAISKLLAGEKVPVYGDGLNIRDWIHVNDHCEAIWRVLINGTPGQIYNIGGGNELPNLDIVKRLVKLAKRDDSYIEFVSDRRGHDQRYSVDDRKIRSELGYAPKINFESELGLVFEWYKRAFNFS